MLLNELFESQTSTDKTTKFIVYDKKTTEVVYYGTSELEANKFVNKKTVLLKPLVKQTITKEQVRRYEAMSTMFY